MAAEELDETKEKMTSCPRFKFMLTEFRRQNTPTQEPQCLRICLKSFSQHNHRWVNKSRE